jgi:hypothetical protein
MLCISLFLFRNTLHRLLCHHHRNTTRPLSNALHALQPWSVYVDDLLDRQNVGGRLAERKQGTRPDAPTHERGMYFGLQLPASREQVCGIETSEPWTQYVT